MIGGERAIVTTILLALFTLVPVAGQVVPYGGREAYLRDLDERRRSTMAALGRDAILVAWSAPERLYSGDVHYEYRQDSNLLYLTGINQPETILVLVTGAKTQRAHLFVRRPEPLRELWTGHTLTSEEVTGRSGIVNVHPQRDTEAFDAFMAALLSGSDPGTKGASADEFSDWFASVAAGRARLGVLGRVGPLTSGQPAQGSDNPGAWAREIEQKHPSVKTFDATEVLTAQRRIKTPYEQQVLGRSVEISADAHIEGMRAARPGRWEYEVEAAIEATFLRNGALSWGYPSIVGSGPNATVLHYLASTRQMQDGDLLLVDAAGNFQGLTGDITRTYPVNGRFTPAQRSIYEIVLRAQQAGIQAARPDGKVEDIVRAVRQVIGDGLAEIGFVTARSGSARDEQISLWMPHDPVHGIGMDVHDPLGDLKPGAAFVIEPGLYIRLDALARLPSSASRTEEARRLTPLIDRYRDVGVRVEDSFVMTPSGPLNLSVKAPKAIADLERIVGQSP